MKAGSEKMPLLVERAEALFDLNEHTLKFKTFDFSDAVIVEHDVLPGRPFLKPTQ